MCIENNVTVDERTILKNAIKTINYFFDALLDQDYETAHLEMKELAYSLKELEKLKDKREKRQQLLDVIEEMKARGINIDFAERSSFLKNTAKNVVEISSNNSNKHKKRQQA